MAAVMGLSPENLDPQDSSQVAKTEPRRILEPDELMERLRGRCNQHKSWTDSIKAVKMAVVGDKRFQSDILEKTQLQSCLDKLHRALKVVSQQSLIERLESIARQLGMSFTPPTSPENHIILSTEMFNIEILLDGQGGVRDVKIGHQENPTSSEELTEVLGKRDFDGFISHLEGLLSIYKISGEKKQKFKAYLALYSLESDLNVLAQLQSSINGVANYIHKSPLGILLPRKAGHPMKLIYYVSPYDLLCKKAKKSHPMTVEAITENHLGHSVTVCLEPSESNRLQTMPLMSVKTHAQDGKRLPSFQALSSVNSFTLPASFVLVLPQPIPVASSVVKAIQEITGLDVVCGEEAPLMSLLLDFGADGKIADGKELFVTLPDQQHVYYLNRLSEGCLGQPGVSLARIPFTHPTSVPKVLNQLRQQLLFNTVIQSLIRPAASQDPNTSLVFELTAVSLQYLSVMFEHPLHSSMVTVELDLSDITSMKCRVCTGTGDENICSDDFVSRAFQRCFSIPVTLRTVIQKVREEIKNLIPPEPVILEPLKVIWHQDNSSHASNSKVPRPMDAWTQNPFELRKLPMLNKTFLEPLPPEEFTDRPPANPLLATLLDQGSPQPDPPPITDSPMLSKLLEENTSVASNPPTFPAPRQKRLGKRKSSKDLLSGRSPKHRLSESDMSDRERHVDLDSSGGSVSDSDHPVRPASASSVGSLGPVSSTGSVIDLTEPMTPDHFSSESHVKKLEDFIQKESRVHPAQQGSEMANLLQNFPPDMEDSHSEGTTPMSHSSPHHVLVPKNEKASTSLEDCLTGSGESREYVDPNALHARRTSQMARMANFKRQNSIGRNSVESMSSGGVSPDMVFSPRMVSPSHSQHIKMEPVNSVDSKAGVLQMGGYPCSAAAGMVQTNINMSHQPVFNSSGKPSLQTLKAHYEIKNEPGSVYPQDREVFKSEEVSVAPVMKLKLSAMKPYDSVSPPESEDSKSRTSAFDFHSDEEESLPVMEKNMTVVSASPTRLQISNKPKVSYNFKFNKNEKYKRKDSKHNSSSDSGKRKRDKDEGRKEKKKKKSSAAYSGGNDGAVYKSTTVQVEGDSENNFKPMPKLKITKSGVKVSIENNVGDTKTEKDGKDKNMHSRSVSMDQGIFDKLESMKNEHLSKNASLDGYTNSKKSVSSKSQKSHKYHQRSLSTGVTVSKSDSKLTTRTPTIKLKPIAVPTSGSSVTVSGTRMPSTPGATTPTTPKAVAASPTSTTIGKIGAVSLATSGTQKSLSSSNNKSPQGIGKSSSSSNKGSIAALLSSKSSGSLQKSSSASGKNSPVPQSKSSNSGGRSSSLSSLSQGGSKSSGTLNRTSSSGKTSSPLSGGQKSSSGSTRNSSSSRDKSTSSKSSLTPPVTTVVTQQTAASVLSFLNPKASSIASLPPIPKKSSAAGNAVKNNSSSSSSTSTNSSSSSSSTSVSSTTTSVSNSKGSTSVSSAVSTSVSNKSISSNVKSSGPSNTTGPARRGSSPLLSMPPNVGSKTGNQSPVSSYNKGPSVPPNSVRGNGPVSSNKGPGFPPANNSGYSSNRNNASINSATTSAHSSNSVTSKSNNHSDSSNSTVTTRNSATPSSVSSVPATNKMANSVSSLGNNSISSRTSASSSSSSGASGSTRKSVSGPSVPDAIKSQSQSQTASSVDDIGKSKSVSLPAQTPAVVTASSAGQTAALSAAARGRKGSLSAVIDKLTCKASTTGSVPGKEQLGNPSAAANKNETADGKTSAPMERKERSKSEGGISGVSLDNSRPNSKNPDLSSVSSKTTVINSNEVSLQPSNHVMNKSPLDSSASKLVIPNNKSFKSFSDSCTTKSNVNKDICKTDGKQSPALLNSSSDSVSVSNVKQGESNSGNVSKESSRADNSSKGDHLLESVDKKNCNDISQGNSVTSQAKEGAHNSVKKPTDSNITPCTSTSEKAKDSVFKVPTPKQPTSDDKDMEDIENLVVRRKVRASSKPIPSPGSPCSSPENGLIIDCPSSPRHLQNKTNSPLCNPDMSVTENRSSNWKTMITHSPKLKPSPINSPSGKDHFDPGSVGNVNSPCVIDDELMDEALGFGT